MTLKSPIALTFLAAALLPLAPALAADYEPPIYVEQAPEYTPVEVGSGWYLRGNVGYNVGDPVYDFTLLGEKAEHNRFSGGIGVGYHFNDWLRSDATISYLGGDKYKFDDGIDALNASHRMWSGLVNGYVDLGTYAGFTPYVGAGLGVLHSRHALSVDSSTAAVWLDATDKQYEFAYALHAGGSYKVSNNVSVDIGYQYLSSPSTKYFNGNTLTMDEGVDQHQVKVGLRYDLW